VRVEALGYSTLFAECAKRMRNPLLLYLKRKTKADSPKGNDRKKGKNNSKRKDEC